MYISNFNESTDVHCTCSVHFTEIKSVWEEVEGVACFGMASGNYTKGISSPSEAELTLVVSYKQLIERKDQLMADKLEANKCLAQSHTIRNRSTEFLSSSEHDSDFEDKVKETVQDKYSAHAQWEFEENILEKLLNSRESSVEVITNAW